MVSNNIHVTLICERLRLHLCPIGPAIQNWDDFIYCSAPLGKHVDQKYSKYSMKVLCQ